jgi:hypothetical protein
MGATGDSVDEADDVSGESATGTTATGTEGDSVDKTEADDVSGESAAATTVSERGTAGDSVDETDVSIGSETGATAPKTGTIGDSVDKIQISSDSATGAAASETGAMGASAFATGATMSKTGATGPTVLGAAATGTLAVIGSPSPKTGTPSESKTGMAETTAPSAAATGASGATGATRFSISPKKDVELSTSDRQIPSGFMTGAMGFTGNEATTATGFDAVTTRSPESLTTTKAPTIEQVGMGLASRVLDETLASCKAAETLSKQACDTIYSGLVADATELNRVNRRFRHVHEGVAKQVDLSAGICNQVHAVYLTCVEKAKLAFRQTSHQTTTPRKLRRL